MNAPDSFATLLARTRESFPASTKSFITGSRADLRVPVRDIALTNGEVVSVYDTSGPYTDPAAIIENRALTQCKAQPLIISAAKQSAFSQCQQRTGSV